MTTASNALLEMDDPLAGFGQPFTCLREQEKRPVNLVVYGIDASRFPFSQAATALVDSSSFEVTLRQRVDVGVAIRLVELSEMATERSQQWYCRVSARSLDKNADDCWTYQLSY